VSSKPAFTSNTIPEALAKNTCLKPWVTGGVLLALDNDGWQDIPDHQLNDWPATRQEVFTGLLYNNEEGTFTDVTKQAGWQ